MTKTKHNDDCTMAYGRKSEEGVCPRCDELRNGAEPRSWNRAPKRDWRREIREHDCERSRCGPVCTAFEW